MSDVFVRPGGPLCLVLLTYTAPLDRIDPLMPDHVAWLTHGFEQGVIVVSGRKTPRTGGVILFRGTRDTVAPIVAAEPSVMQGLAEVEIVEFTANMAMPALADLTG